MRSEPAGDFDYERVGSVLILTSRDPRSRDGSIAARDAHRPERWRRGRFLRAGGPSSAGRGTVSGDAGTTTAHRGPAIDVSAESLPFDDQSFDAAMATVTVHQWSDHKHGLPRASPRVAWPGRDPHRSTAMHSTGSGSPTTSPS